MMLDIELNFKKWAESIFSRSIMDDPEPASEIPMILNKIQNGAFPSYNPDENDPLITIIKKRHKRKR